MSKVINVVLIREQKRYEKKAGNKQLNAKMSALQKQSRIKTMPHERTPCQQTARGESNRSDGQLAVSLL